MGQTNPERFVSIRCDKFLFPLAEKELMCDEALRLSIQTLVENLIGFFTTLIEVTVLTESNQPTVTGNTNGVNATIR